MSSAAARTESEAVGPCGGGAWYERLNRWLPSWAAVFKKLRGKGKLTEQDIKDAMREVRMALLEADVNYKVAKDFIAKRHRARRRARRCMESLTPAQQVIKIVNEELTALMGGSEAARHPHQRPSRRRSS